VIAIMGVLIGLLLPAVQMARESGRRGTCANNLRQWGHAMHAYEHAYGVLPLGVSEYRCIHHTWIAVLWPFIEQQALADRYRWNVFFRDSPNATQLTSNPVGPITQRLPGYYCPSDKPNATYIVSSNRIATRVNYVVNATNRVVTGRRFVGPFHRKHQPDGTFTYCGPEPGQNGLSTGPGLSWVALTGQGYKGPLARRFRHITDGLSRTLMMAEAIVWPDEAVAGQPSDPRGTHDLSFFDARITPNSAFDVVASWVVPPNYSPGCIDRPPSLPCQITGNGNDNWIFASRSRHPGGVQGIMCDGSVRFTSDFIDQITWQSLGTMNGGEVDTSK
jgi:hypothetical protein